ncbi:MAG: toxin-antitoxin system YwqK family antitoxin [Chlamydiales bacterium]|nr:toxin-antitoxin system YwqK family antitoxin [Chlamydiales bacterium]
MKKSTSLGVASLLLLATATGCRQNNRYSDVVKETYIHQYGVPVIKSDWDQQGQEGKIVKLKKNGVTLTQTFSKGILDGESTYTFPNSSTIHLLEVYDNGELIAKRENFPSGILAREEVFQQGVLFQFNSWYEDGTPASTEIYRGDYLAKGEYRTPMNIAEARVENGQGIRVRRASDGELLSKDTIQNGKMVERVTYFANGDPATITPYLAGQIHGTRLTFLQGGLPNTSEQWMQGKQEGVTVVYLNGEKYAEVPYINGKKNGIEVRYRDGSVLVEEITWKEGVQHGVHKFYIDGNAKVEWYNQGEVVTRATYERLNQPR